LEKGVPGLGEEQRAVNSWRLEKKKEKWMGKGIVGIKRRVFINARGVPKTGGGRAQGGRGPRKIKGVGVGTKRRKREHHTREKKIGGVRPQRWAQEPGVERTRQSRKDLKRPKRQ